LIGTQPTKNLLDTVIPFKVDLNSEMRKDSNHSAHKS
jgi:hypothetical protein